MAQKYNSSQDSIVGDKLMLFIKDGEALLPVAFGTSCTIQLSTDTIDTSNKMGGNWKESLTGQLGWTASSESLLSLKDGHMSFKTMKKLMAARTPVSIVVGKSKSAEEDFAVDTELVKGEAIITSLSMTADNGSISTASIELQGNGPLEDGAAPASI